MKSIFTITFLIILTISGISQYIPSPDSSAWPTSPDSGLVIGYGDFPQIVSDANGGAIVAFWANTPTEVKVKRVDQYGWLQWNGFSGVVAGGSGLYQELEKIIEDGRGGCFVAFLDITEVNPYPPFDKKYALVTVQHIDHNGNKLWGNGIPVSPVDSVLQVAPELQPDGQGGCILSWYDSRNVTDPNTQYYDIYTQRLDSLGNLCWGDSAIRISDTTMAMASVNDAQVDSAGNSYIRWGSRLQKLNINGVKLWPVQGINLSIIPVEMGLIHPQNGIIYAGTHDSIYGNDQYRLMCQRIDSSGQKLWGYYGVTLVDSIIFNKSKVTGLLFDDLGNLFISYSFAKSGDPDVYLQKLAPDGTKLFGKEGMKISEYPSSKNGGGIILSDDNVLCVWTDNRGNGGTYIQKFDFFGNRFWNNDILFYSDAFNDFTHDGYGGLIIVDRQTGFSINLSKISKNGIIGEVLSSIEDKIPGFIPDGFILHQNYPNPFNNSTTISYQLSKISRVELSIYDVTGKKLNTVIKDKQLPGLHEFRLNLSNYSSGVYFYRLGVNGESITKKLLLIR